MERKALVIGNNNYRKLRNLNNAVNDAHSVCRVLALKGFEIDFFENLGFESFLEKVHRFGNLIEGFDGLVLFYYAGHSMQLMDSNYLLPVDIDDDLSTYKSVEEGAIYLGDITQALNKFNGEKIIVLDACRNHDFKNEIIASSEIFNKGLSEIESSHGMAIIYSTQPGNTASDGAPGSSNGCFTEELVKNIRQYGLTLEDIIIKTREGVLSKTNFKQIPWSSNSIHKEIYIDQIRFPGDLISEIKLPSNGVDTISCSESIVFVATEKKQIFLINNSSEFSPIKNSTGQVMRYLKHYPYAVSLDVGGEDYINEAYFLDDDVMLAVSESGYLYMYDIQCMLAESNGIDPFSGFPKTDYRPSVLFDESHGDHFFCINGFGSYVFFGGSLGTLYRINVSDIKSNLLSKRVDCFSISNHHITSIAVNPCSGSICVTDEQFIYFLSKSIDVVRKERVRSSNILYSEKLGFVVASNSYELHFFDDIGRKVKKSVSLVVKQHPLVETKVDDLFITSLDILDERYLVIGTDKPSLIMFDVILDTVVNEKFLDIHMTSPFSSAVYDVCVYRDEFLFSRSKMHHIGMWKLEKN